MSITLQAEHPIALKHHLSPSDDPAHIHNKPRTTRSRRSPRRRRGPGRDHSADEEDEEDDVPDEDDEDDALSPQDSTLDDGDDDSATSSLSDSDQAEQDHQHPSRAQGPANSASSLADDALPDLESGLESAQIQSATLPSLRASAKDPSFSPLISSTTQSNQARDPPKPSSPPVPNNSHNTTIILNQASWVTGLSAALGASPTPADASASSVSLPSLNASDDHPMQTPRYIPFIEFENYSSYGNLIFDLNTGLGRTARIDCKPDGLEKAPPQALEQMFIRMKPSRDEPESDLSLRPRTESQRHSRRKARLNPDVKPSDNQPQIDCHDGDALNTVELEMTLPGTSDKMKKKKKKKKRDAVDCIPPKEAPFTLHVTSPDSQRNPSTLDPSPSHLNSAHNRPPSSTGTGSMARPTSAMGGPAPSDGYHSTSASEPFTPEPWAVPRSGRFWGHDDRQNYLSRRGSGRGFFRGRGAGVGGVRGGAGVGKRGFRAGWPSSSPSSRRPLDNHHSGHRPDTPAGQSDTARSVGSGAGWITVQSKQRGMSHASNHVPHQPSHHQRIQPHQVEDGEWRHDGWEEIERETDRKGFFHNRGRGSRLNYAQYRGRGSGPGGPKAPSQLRRPLQPNNHARSSDIASTTPSTEINGGDQAAQVISDGWTTKSPGPGPALASGTVDREVKVSLKTNPPNAYKGREEEDKNVVPSSQVASIRPPESCVGGKLTNTLQAEKVHPVERCESAGNVCDANLVVVKLPKAIKIGTIPVYHPSGGVVADESQKAIAETLVGADPSIRSRAQSVPCEARSPSTPELSHTPLVSRGSSTAEDRVAGVPSSSEAVPGNSGTITLGSLGGAEVLRQAMSAGNLDCAPPPISHGDLSARQHHHLSEPVNVLAPNSCNYPMAHDAVYDPGPPNSFNDADSPALNSMSFASRPPPPMSLPATFQQPPLPPAPQSNFYQPPLPPLPPLQFFDPQLSYSHQVSVPPAPGPMFGGYLPPPMPPPMPPPPPMYHHPSAVFEPTPPPQAPPAPSTVMTPGLYAPPKSTKVRISTPGGSENQTTYAPRCDESRFGAHDSGLGRAGMMGTTDTGISYYEFNGVTYFGNVGPQASGGGHHPAHCNVGYSADRHYQTPPLPPLPPSLPPPSIANPSSQGTFPTPFVPGGLGNPVPVGNGGSNGGIGGQVVLSEVIRPVGIPFG